MNGASALLLMGTMLAVGVPGCDWYGNLWKGYTTGSSGTDNGCGMPAGQGGAGIGGAGMGGAGIGGGDVGATVDVGAGVGGSGEPGASPQTVPCDGNPGGQGGADQCFGKPADTYIDCRTRGLDAIACSDACAAAGAACGPIAAHPYKKNVGTGQLTWCKNGEPTFTCTYTFKNGDGCALTLTPIKNFWICCYGGGQ